MQKRLIFPFVKHLYLSEFVHAFQRKGQLPFALICLLHTHKMWLNRETLCSQCPVYILFLNSALFSLQFQLRETFYLKCLPELLPCETLWLSHRMVSRYIQAKIQVDTSFWGFDNLLCFKLFIMFRPQYLILLFFFFHSSLSFRVSNQSNKTSKQINHIIIILHLPRLGQSLGLV